MTLIAVFADVIAPYGENEIDLFNITAKPSAEHWLGTDELGRDELSRLMFGARVSLLVGVGAASDLDRGRHRRRLVGRLLRRLGRLGADALRRRHARLSRHLPVAHLLLDPGQLGADRDRSSWGSSPGCGWRGSFVESFSPSRSVTSSRPARSIGVPDGRLMWRHLLPNVGAAIIVSTTLTIAYAMLSEATLSFLGFGVPPGTPTWGNMLNAARPNYIQVPVLAIAPGLTLTIAVLAINFVGDGLRDALDPRGRG